MKKGTKEQFIERVSNIYGKDTYDYSKFIYIGNGIKGIIICKIHGEFNKTPANHLRGQGCPDCAKEKGRIKRTFTKERFVNDAWKVHGEGTYDYSKFEYVTARIPGIIICHIHGEFPQAPYSHLAGTGCPHCFGHVKLTAELVIQRAENTHGKGTYDYSKVEYINYDTKIIIICPIHGEFLQTPYHHILGEGCRKCGRIRVGNLLRKSIETFIEEVNLIQGKGKYDYSKFIYVSDNTKGIIICPKHGEFLQTPGSHLSGHGCQKCSCRVSKKCQVWLKSFNNPNIEVEKIVRIEKIWYFVDGIDYTTNTVYEFNGGLWHGDLRKYNPDDINPINKKTYGELYRKTLEKKENLEKAGYTVISIWESDFDELIKKTSI